MRKICTTLLLLGIAIQTAAAEPIRVNIDHDGRSRSYHVYIPSSYTKGQPAPLVIVLHGRTSDGLRMADLTSFNIRAEEYGFIVVYPEGIDHQWNYLHGILAFKARPNDSDFLLEIADVVQSQYSIDKNRIYVTGISNGGFMAQRLACYAPRKFAAFASVAAGGYASMSLECENKSPVNMLYMHGTADEKVPWQGLGIKDTGGNRQLVTMSITNSVKFWSERNQCGPDVDSKEILPTGNSPGTQVKIFTSSDCKNNSQVVLYAIIGGGHNWPGAPNIIPPEIAGRVNLDIHASDVIWSFFNTKKLNR